jgi:hypothetical protein
MRTETLDPTAGERARVIHERGEDPPEITDPTAGETARANREHRPNRAGITDPTDPRYGRPSGAGPAA